MLKLIEKILVLNFALLWLNFLFNISLAAAKNGAPKINVTDSVLIIEKYSNITISCEDKEEVEWCQSDRPYAQQVETKNYNLSSSQNIYKSELILTNVSTEHSGLFGCMRKADRLCRTDTRGDNFLNLFSVMLTSRDKVSSFHIHVKEKPRKFAPEINSTKTVFLERFANLTITCVADEPVDWYDDGFPLQEREYEAEDCSTSKQHMKYCKNLVLKYVTSKAIGNYYCSKELKNSSVELSGFLIGQHLIDKNIASKIHVYVKDSINKFKAIKYNWLHAIKNKDLIIPCMPSMPTNNVQLMTPQGKILFSTDKSEQIRTENPSFLFDSIQYNPEFGFYLQNIRSFVGNVYCGSNNIQYLKWNIVFQKHKTYCTSKTYITSDAYHVAVKGQNFRLYCNKEFISETCDKPKPVWILPRSVNKTRVRIQHPNDYQSVSTLTVVNAQPTDSGIYSCRTINQKTAKEEFEDYQMDVKDEPFFFIHELNHNKVFEQNANQSLDIIMIYRIYPDPSMTWYNHMNEEITQFDSRYGLLRDYSTFTLTIKNAQMTDSGKYTLHVKSGKTESNITFDVCVSDLPIVELEGDIYLKPQETERISCHVNSCPAPSEVVWEFNPVGQNWSWPSCDQQGNEVAKNNTPSHKVTQLRSMYELPFFPTQTPGVLRCIARNKVGLNFSCAKVFVVDYTDSITIVRYEPEQTIVKGQDVELNCTVSAYFYTENIVWLHNGSEISLTKISSKTGNYSHTATLKLEKIQTQDAGNYECFAYPLSNAALNESRSVILNVSDPRPPFMNDTNFSGETVIKQLGDSLELYCFVDALPTAKFSWYKNDIELKGNENIITLENNSTLKWNSIKAGDEGFYKCNASNDHGEPVVAIGELRISNLPHINPTWITIAAVLLALLLSGLLVSIVRYKRTQKKLSGLRAAGLADFEAGNVERINSELPLDEQATLLPYDRRYEFPCEQITLREQLGSGEFGVVFKAQAKGIKKDEAKTTVAVKKVNKTADNDIILTLVSELKIMIYLGHHPNIVNLLGAVTTNITKRDIMVIVEFCSHGSTKSFLMNNEKRFVNQIDPITKKIDATITNETASLKCMQTANQMKFTTSDLVSWSVQVARGMDYLASKNIIHGDLAARNILLCDNNVVKICDFGLSRKLYSSKYHRKQPGAILPRKWLALESLAHDIFTIYSDIWSFGIVLWEFFTLGQVPYFGLEVDEIFLEKLQNGYRLNMPRYATDGLYNIMCKCWRKNPKSRPVFKQLETELERILSFNDSDLFNDEDIVLDERQNTESSPANDTDEPANGYLELMNLKEKPVVNAGYILMEDLTMSGNISSDDDETSETLSTANKFDVC